MDRTLIFNTRTGNRRHVIELNVYRPYGIAKKKRLDGISINTI